MKGSTEGSTHPPRARWWRYRRRSVLSYPDELQRNALREVGDLSKVCEGKRISRYSLLLVHVQGEDDIPHLERALKSEDFPTLGTPTIPI